MSILYCCSNVPLSTFPTHLATEILHTYLCTYRVRLTNLVFYFFVFFFLYLATYTTDWIFSTSINDIKDICNVKCFPFVFSTCCSSCFLSAHIRCWIIIVEICLLQKSWQELDEKFKYIQHSCVFVRLQLRLKNFLK